jgi:hypothetical protein
MEMKIGVKANVTWELRRDGKVIDSGERHNLLLEDGYEIIVDLLGGLGGQGELVCIAVGDSDTAVSSSQTDLQGAEMHRDTCTNVRVGHRCRCYYNFAAGEATGTIKEAIIADTNAVKGARKCAARVVIGPIVKGAPDALHIIWDFDFEVV